jgi:hypothetical protein
MVKTPPLGASKAARLGPWPELLKRQITARHDKGFVEFSLFRQSRIHR